MNDKKNTEEPLSACLILNYLHTCVTNEPSNNSKYLTALWLTSQECEKNMLIKPSLQSFYRSQLNMPNPNPLHFQTYDAYIKPPIYKQLWTGYLNCLDRTKGANRQACSESLQAAEDAARGYRVSGK